MIGMPRAIQNAENAIRFLWRSIAGQFRRNHAWKALLIDYPLVQFFPNRTAGRLFVQQMGGLMMLKYTKIVSARHGVFVLTVTVVDGREVCHLRTYPKRG